MKRNQYIFILSFVCVAFSLSTAQTGGIYIEVLGIVIEVLGIVSRL